MEVICSSMAQTTRALSLFLRAHWKSTPAAISSSIFSAGQRQSTTYMTRAVQTEVSARCQPGYLEGIFDGYSILRLMLVLGGGLFKF